MADLLSLLAGSLGGEQDYWAQDPFFGAGRSVASWDLPRPTSNAEAIFGPALQGGLAGLLTGYGMKSANQSAYKDYSSILRPLQGQSDFVGPPTEEQALHGYLSETAPEGWTPKIGKSDLVLASLMQEAQREQEAKKLERQYDMEKLLAGKGVAISPDGTELTPIPGLAEAEAQASALKKSSEIKAEREAKGAIADLPPVVQTELGKSKAVVDEARSIASALEESGKSWTDLQTQKAFSGADKDGIALALKNLADKLARARTGAAMSKEEVKLYSDLVGGDLSASPKQVASLLKKLAEAESRTAKSQIDFHTTAQSGNPDALKGAFDMQMPTPPPGYELTGKKDSSGNWGIRRTR